MAPQNEYVMGGLETESESQRLGLLETVRDPATVRRLTELGVASGWRCLELGAGHGSIARWLADVVGQTGSVVAVDIDTRFLTDLPDNVEVRKLDIRADGVEAGAYDIAHCRAFLMHLPDPAATLAVMADALAPGGLLLAEEADYGLLYYGGDPESDELTRVAHWGLGRLAEARIVDTFLGRRLPALLAEAGLELLGATVDTGISRPGEPRYEFAAKTALDAAPRLIAAGFLDDAGLARLTDYFAQRSSVITGPSLVSAWARKPDR